MYGRYKETLSNYAVDLDFYWCCPHSLQALSKVCVKHLLAAVRVKRGQILPVKATLFLFFCRSEMYSYHRNNIATIWHMQGKFTTVLMQRLFPQMFQKESDKGLIEVLLTLQNAFLSYWGKKTNVESNPLHGGSPVPSLGKLRGGGFVFLKHYHC